MTAAQNISIELDIEMMMEDWGGGGGGKEFASSNSYTETSVLT